MLRPRPGESSSSLIGSEADMLATQALLRTQLGFVYRCQAEEINATITDKGELSAWVCIGALGPFAMANPQTWHMLANEVRRHHVRKLKARSEQLLRTNNEAASNLAEEN